MNNQGMDSPGNPPSKRPRAAPWLRRADQGVVGFLLLAGITALSGYWFAQTARHGRLLEVEQLAPQTAAFRVDVNSAPWPELSQLPGVGKTLARRIVASREAEGPFVDHDDLSRVRGIGPRTLERLKPYLLPMPPRETVAGP